MMSSSTGRFTQPKIEFSCICGKKYRVKAEKAGKKVRCKRCRAKCEVPGDTAISMRTRKAILDEIGIDADAAERAYEAEQEAGYACAVCANPLADDQLKAAYGEEGLICSDCRAHQIEERGLDYKRGDDKAKKKQDAKLDRWTASPELEQVKRKALGFSALFLVGTGGLVHNVFGAELWVTALVAATVAFVGYRMILKTEYVPADE